VFTTRRLSELLAQFADKDINNLEFGLVHPALEVVEEHLFRQRGTLAQAEQFENPILLAGEVHRLILDRDDAGVDGIAPDTGQ
jgi:hypothetical protein